MPYVGLENIPSRGAQLTGWQSANASISANAMFRAGDVLFGKLRPNLRKCLVAPFDGYCSTDILVLRANPGIAPGYAGKVLRTELVGAAAEMTAVGTKMPRTSWKHLSELQVFCPDFDEQSKIDCILDTLDAAIHETEAIIAKLKAIKQGLLHDLLTRGIATNGELRQPQAEAPHLYKESPLGWIPKEWDAVELNQLVDPGRPVVYGILMPGYGHPGGIPVVKVKDIFDEGIQLEGLLLTSPQIDREYSRSRLQQGDLLFTIRGTVGRMALVPAQLAGANITQDTARVAVKASDARFVMACLATHTAARFVANHTLGVAVQGINLRDVRRIPLPKPPRCEAVEIANRLDAIAKRLLAELERCEKLAISKAGLMDDLLTGRVRVTPLLESSTP